MEKMSFSEFQCKFSWHRIGNYSITRKSLGSGHFAKVVQAVHKPTQVKVAVKIIDRQKVSESEYLSKNVGREANILAKLHHPGIIKMFQIAQTPKYLFLFLELGGENLCDFIYSQNQEKCDEPLGKRLAKQIVAAVSYIHKKGFVHRDIKLDNILINRDTYRVKLIDFGLSNFYSPGTFLQTNCGSPEYAAPELHLGMRYNSKVDIWSLGVVFFGMMVGQLPFALRNPKNKTSAERKDFFRITIQKGIKSPKHQKMLASTSPSFRDLLKNLLEPNPGDRFDITELENHRWVYDEYIEKYQEIDEKWKLRAIEEIKDLASLDETDVRESLAKKPYGIIGGCYNIKKFLYLENRISSDLRKEATQRSRRPQTSLEFKKEIPKLTNRPQTENSETKKSRIFSNFPNIKKIVLKFPC